MPSEHHYYVYLMTNWNNKVVYVGMTNNLERRVYEHKQKLVQGFTEKYKVNKLVYFEETSEVWAALAREKEIKKWRREKKNVLVGTINPEWKDLSAGWFEVSRCGPDDKEESVLYDGVSVFDMTAEGALAVTGRIPKVKGKEA